MFSGDTTPYKVILHGVVSPNSSFQGSRLLEGGRPNSSVILIPVFCRELPHTVEYASFIKRQPASRDALLGPVQVWPRNIPDVSPDEACVAHRVVYENPWRDAGGFHSFIELE